MINFDPKMNPLLSQAKIAWPQTESPGAAGVRPDGVVSDFSQVAKAVGKYVSTVDDSQRASDTSIQDLLTGKNNDLTAVVSAVAEADVSFKVLVGVRNKLIEAYKQTMNMPL
jgi:flagellar hook-basal body complex protein FliE